MSIERHCEESYHCLKCLREGVEDLNEENYSLKEALRGLAMWIEIGTGFICFENESCIGLPERHEDCTSINKLL